MVNVIGLGYIGLPTALMLASHGVEVVGTDYNSQLVATLNAGKTTFEEKGLDELFCDAVKAGITFTTEYQSTDMYIVSVPTPYDKFSKKIDACYVIAAVEEVLKVCKKNATVVIESTVSPGTIDKFVRPVIEAKGFRTGEDINLVHAPERIIPGNMVYELLNNSRTIGADSVEVGEKVKELYSSFCEGDIVVTDIKTAEMTKVIENTYRAVNIAFANELAKICRQDDMDVYEIIKICNMHPRVNILSPGPGVGGHCISVDPWFLVGDYPSLTKVIGESMKVNESMPEFVLERIYEIMKEENMGIDLVSSGEIATAVKAGFPMEKSFFHGNNKTDFDINFAMDSGVGHFMVDNMCELQAINTLAGERGIVQKVILRLTPGIDPHTYAAVATGKVDSKFGIAIETNQAEAFVKEAKDFENIEIVGYHCHVGSQVFNEDGNVYLDAATIMLRFFADMYHKYDVKASVLNMGGGFGVRYVDTDPYLDIDANIKVLADHIRDISDKLGIPMPKILMEPGRSIAADAGMTLYSVGTIKEITGYKNYVSIDGGMTDNPRYALYGSKYTVLLANRMSEECNFKADVAGRCCESGDIIQPDVIMPKPVRGDIVAVCTTGAYNYSMASNYNRVPRPPVVMLSGGEDYVAVKRETFEDLIRNDV